MGSGPFEAPLAFALLRIMKQGYSLTSFVLAQIAEHEPIICMQHISLKELQSNPIEGGRGKDKERARKAPI